MIFWICFYFVVAAFVFGMFLGLYKDEENPPIYVIFVCSLLWPLFIITVIAFSIIRWSTQKLSK